MISRHERIVVNNIDHTILNNHIRFLVFYNLVETDSFKLYADFKKLNWHQPIANKTLPYHLKIHASHTNFPLIDAYNNRNYLSAQVFGVGPLSRSEKKIWEDTINSRNNFMSIYKVYLTDNKIRFDEVKFSLTNNSKSELEIMTRRDDDLNSQ
jgi:hypothetical protein